MLTTLREKVSQMFKKEIPFGETGISIGTTYRNSFGVKVTIVEHRPSKGLYSSFGFDWIGSDGKRYDSNGTMEAALFEPIVMLEAAIQ